MTRTRWGLILLGVLTLFPGGNAFGQVATGTPPFSSADNKGFETIDLANLNVHFGIPIFRRAGRGMPFSHALSYDSSVWYPSGAVWTPVYNWGWTGPTQMATGYVDYTSVQKHCNVGTPQDPFFVYYTNFTYKNYHDPVGVLHYINATVTTDDGTCTSNPVNATTVTLTDGSGFKIYVDDGPSAIVYPKGGGSIDTPLQSGTGAGTRTDSNGNQITTTGTAFYDTLSSTTAALSTSGTAPNPVSFTYTPPAGGSASYTLKYTTYTLQTNFGCSGISEYGPSSVALVSEIDLPDGSKYTLTYEGTPGHSGNVTGRLASVTLPTGGTITYTYNNGNFTGSAASNGIVCADGSTAGLTRATTDGTWTYARSGTSPAYTTTISDPTAPTANQTVIKFQGLYETQRQSYQGSTSGTLLQTVNTCYNGVSSPCTATAVTLPITQKTVIIQFPNSGLSAKHNYLYNSYGLPTELDDYDWTSGTFTLIRKVLTTYASLGNGIVDRVATVTVQDGSGNTSAQTSTNYDETSVASTSGTPNHVSVSGSRGNPTTVSTLVRTGTSLSKTFTYYDTGTVKTATDVNGAVTTYNYSDAIHTCGNAFPTSVSLPLSLSISQTWNCTGAVTTQTTDANGNNASTSYTDSYFWRPASSTDQANATTNITYPLTSPYSSVESSLSFNSGNSVVDKLATVDALGRPHLAQTKQGPSVSNYDSVETDYDSLGRAYKVTVPYGAGAGVTSGNISATTTTFDPVGRPLAVTDGGSGTVNYTYSQNDVLIVVGPAPTGENIKQRQSEYDALGRLTSICEITGATGSGTCGQTSSKTGYWTKYTYDAAGRLTGVIQNAQASSSQQQTRSYSYDLAGRLTQEVNAESGTTNYVYDSDSTCGTSTGDLVKRTDAVGNVTCYALDALHRETSITYPSGSYASSTSSKYFIYDSATVNSQAMANAKGRLAEAYTCTTCPGTKLTDLGFSYTVRGQISDIYESTPHSSGYYHVSASYWAHGAVDTLNMNLTGVPNWTYSPDGEGRPSTVNASSGQNPVTSMAYSLYSAPPNIQVTLGSGDSDTFTFDANTGRMTQYKFTIGATPQNVVGNLTWNANGSLASLAITDPLNSANQQTCTYSHDDLSRIASANCGGAAAQTFTYDAFGNVSKSGSPNSFQPTYSPTTNRMISLPGFTPSYDSNGNVTNDSLHQYSWDSEGRAITIDSVTLIYDALGRMVEQNRSGTYTQIVYSPGGSKLALMNGQTLQKAFIGLPGGGAAVYNSGGLAYYRHVDWLGSSRLATTPSRTMYSSTAYAPFGETYAPAGTADPSFTGQNQDTASNAYDSMFREYMTQGRWPSPDPAGRVAVRPGNPQSWNRYAYVLNYPLVSADPTGLCDETQYRQDPERYDANGHGGPSGEADMDASPEPQYPHSCVDRGGLGGALDGGGSPLPAPGEIDWLTAGFNAVTVAGVFSGAIPVGTSATAFCLGTGCPGNAHVSGPGGFLMPTGLLAQASMTVDYNSTTDETTYSDVTTQIVAVKFTLTLAGDVPVGNDIFHSSSNCLGCGSVWPSSNTVVKGLAIATAVVVATPLAVELGGAEAGNLLGDKLVYGENALQAGDYHAFPSLLDSVIVEEGSVSTGAGTYIQYNLAGFVNGVSGTFQVGGYWVTPTTFYMVHHFFRP